MPICLPVIQAGYIFGFSCAEPMKLSAKVLIIGGGPAGASAARYLAAHGRDVLLLEKNLSFEKPCGGGLSLCAFEEFDIPKTAVKREVHRIRIVSPRGEGVDIALQGCGLAIVGRKEFDSSLRQAAEAKGAKIVGGEFTGIQVSKDYKVTAMTGEEQLEFDAEYVIAADGVNSRVRTALGIKPSRSFFTVSETIRDVNADVCEFWFGGNHAPFSYSWVFPASEGISIGTATFQRGTITALLQRFKEKRGLPAAGTKKVYRIPEWKGDLYSKGNVLFAGDAAGQVLPLTYEGIYYAMKSGELAAQAIIEERVATYRKEWKARFQRRFVLMERLRNYFLKDDASAERLVALHRRPEIQEASLQLWVMKDNSHKGLLRYIKLFGKFLR
jgi:geranylgeranyl diphosphate/geranylgeranyl-bacteriochlorophyllide a reductase